MNLLLILILLTAPGLTDPNPTYEQIATDYFFDSIWTKKYQDYRAVEFKNKSDTGIYVGHVYAGCKEWSKEDKEQMQVGMTEEEVELNCKLSNISIKKYSKSKRLKVRISARVKLGDTFVVQIDVYKPLEFVDHFFIKLEVSGKIIDQCTSSEII